MLQQNCFYYQCLFLFVVDSTLTTNHWSVVNTTASENWTRYQNPSGSQREAGKKRKRESDRQNDMKSEATAASVTLLSCLILVSPDRLTAEQETTQIHTKNISVCSKWSFHRTGNNLLSYSLTILCSKLADFWVHLSHIVLFVNHIVNHQNKAYKNICVDINQGVPSKIFSVVHWVSQFFFFFCSICYVWNCLTLESHRPWPTSSTWEEALNSACMASRRHRCSTKEK